MKNNVIIIFCLLFILIIVIILNKKINIGSMEYFESPEVSTTGEVEGGASKYYGWKYKPIEDRRRHKHHRKIKCPKCDNVYIDDNVCNIVIDERHRCRHCDITKNKNIDKYVLKSSIPPCPDMSKFATKNMVDACPNMNRYILKSKLPEYCQAFRPDNNRYILKSRIPPCPQCPRCPDYSKYDIRKHPEIVKYVTKDQCQEFKKSWVQDIEEWLKGLFSKNNKKDFGKGPAAYSYSPYTGYGTNNPGYGLDGGNVKFKI